jgi:hypothetical protein
LSSHRGISPVCCTHQQVKPPSQKNPHQQVDSDQDLTRSLFGYSPHAPTAYPVSVYINKPPKPAEFPVLNPSSPASRLPPHLPALATPPLGRSNSKGKPSRLPHRSFPAACVARRGLPSPPPAGALTLDFLACLVLSLCPCSSQLQLRPQCARL